MKYKAEELVVTINARGGSGNSANWQWNIYVKGPGGARLAHGMASGTRASAERSASQVMAKLIASDNA